MALTAYLPQDRLRALKRGETLPDRTRGAALFADISGFTPLTEVLIAAFGPRRGAEELTGQLEMVYSALIAKIQEYGGSVIDFAGDSMLCWFDAPTPDNASQNAEKNTPSIRAVACAFALQQAMQAFAKITLPNNSTIGLTLKIAIASGDARRFVVGNPQIHVMDALTGATITRTAVGEHLAQQGDIVADEATFKALGDNVTLREWRTDETRGERFAVLGTLTKPIEPWGIAPIVAGNLSDAALQAWVYRPIVERIAAGQSTFLTEFRPCVAMFVRFTGIDFDRDDAGAQLDRLIRTAQEIAAKYDGTFLQITIGDKGSYAYINFGVLTTHEDDARRAVRAAVELREAAQQMDFLEPLQIGITQGTMRAGAIGGQTRKSFGAMGADVNLAARLMTNAQPGEILVSGRVHNAVTEYFGFEPREPLALKGKTEPVTVFALKGAHKQRAIKLQEPNYSLPMVGRSKELQLVGEKLELALQNKSQVIGIVAEAGMGKSRLVAEVIRLARNKGFVGYGGACQSDGLYTPYLVWKTIWQAFFELDQELTTEQQMHLLGNEIRARVPARVKALPLLNLVLDTQIPENEFTQHLEPKSRQSALHALLEDCLKAAAQDEPQLIVMEDLHWIDAASKALLEQLAQALANARICFVLAYRSPQLMRQEAPRIETLPHFTRIDLQELSRAEAEQAIRAKLAQLYPAHSGNLPDRLTDRLVAHTQGNPFYLEELLSYLHDRHFDLSEPAVLDKIELPDSLHTLVLARIDQLTEREKTTLRAASIIGRLFRAGWLIGYYPELGSSPEVQAALDTLESVDLTAQDSPEPELAYLFKHVVTHQVTYENLPFSLRARLHEQLARYLEDTHPTAAPVELLAYHYGHSTNVEKQRVYLRRAGQAAQAAFANDAALAYYAQLLPLLEIDAERSAIYLERGRVLELKGDWADAESDYRAALEIAQQSDDMRTTAQAQFALGKVCRLRSDYADALNWLAQAQAVRTALGDKQGVAQVLIETGIVLRANNTPAQAQTTLKQGLALARESGDQQNIAFALGHLGHVAGSLGDYPAARVLFQESLDIHRTLGNKQDIAQALNFLGVAAQSHDDYETARALHQESLDLRREIGDKQGIAACLHNLASAAMMENDYETMRVLSEQGLALNRELGAKWGISVSLEALGDLYYWQSKYTTAEKVFQESLALRQEINSPYGISLALANLAAVALARGDYARAETLAAQAMEIQNVFGDKWIISILLDHLGHLAFAQAQFEKARKIFQECLDIVRGTGHKQGIALALIGLGSVLLKQNEIVNARALFQESLSVAQDLNYKEDIANALLALVLTESETQENAAMFARDQCTTALSLYNQAKNPLKQISAIIGLAELAHRAGNAVRAAQYLAAADTALVKIGAVAEAQMIHRQTQTTTAVRRSLGESAFRSAQQEASTWSLEEAVQYALGDNA